MHGPRGRRSPRARCHGARCFCCYIFIFDYDFFVILRPALRALPTWPRATRQANTRQELDSYCLLDRIVGQSLTELLSTDLDSYSTETHVPGRQGVKLDSSTDLDTVTELDRPQHEVRLRLGSSMS